MINYNVNITFIIYNVIYTKRNNLTKFFIHKIMIFNLC
jgi:hypothetical protein